MRIVIADSAVPRIIAGMIICERFCTGFTARSQDKTISGDQPHQIDGKTIRSQGAEPQARDRQHQDREGAAGVFVAHRVLADRGVDADRDRHHQCHHQRHDAELEGDRQRRCLGGLLGDRRVLPQGAAQIAMRQDLAHTHLKYWRRRSADRGRAPRSSCSRSRLLALISFWRHDRR